MAKSTEADIQLIADHYKKMHPRWNLKPGERRKIIAFLLIGYTAEQICDAATGMHLSSHHMGKNDRGEVYIGFDYIFREHNFDKFCKLAEDAGEAKEVERRKLKEDVAKRRRDERDRLSAIKRKENGHDIRKEVAKAMRSSPGQ